MDGLEVARRLRQDPGLKQALLVALTGYSQEEDRQRSEEAGLNVHLVKPVGPGSVKGLLARPSVHRSGADGIGARALVVAEVACPTP
jgi:CheY-like chemotaxis protein